MLVGWLVLPAAGLKRNNMHRASTFPFLQQQRGELPRASTQALSLRRNLAWSLAGNGVYAACQWMMLVVLARIGSPETVGLFALALAVTAPVFLFSNLKLRSVQATDVRGEYAFGDYLGLRLITAPLALVVVVAITIVAGYSGPSRLIIVMLGFAKMFEAISDVLYGLMQQHERMDRIAASLMIRGGVSLAVLAILVVLTGSLQWGAAGLAVTWALVLLVYDAPTAIRVLSQTSSSSSDSAKRAEGLTSLKPRWDAGTLWRLAWLTLPLGLVVMLGSLDTNVPRYFVEHYLGTHELGIFAASAYFLVAGGIVVSGLAQSATPRLARHYAAGDIAAFRSLLGKMMVSGAVLGVLGVLTAVVAGRHILAAVYGGEYAARSDIFVWLMVDAAVGYAYVFLGTALSAMRRFRIQLPIHLLTVAVLLTTSPLLIDRYGAKGAAWAMLASGLIEASSYSIVILRRSREAVGGSDEPSQRNTR